MDRSNGHSAGNGADKANGNGSAKANGNHRNGSHANGVQPTDVVVHANGNGSHKLELSALPSLFAAEVHELPGGRVRCHVTLEVDGETHVGIGDVNDRPGARLELAARVTADALRAARKPGLPVQVDGVTVAEVAGRAHVLVALGLWTGDEFEPRTGVATVEASFEEAAARAVLSALTR
jgi:hypothetical protein